MSIVLGSLVSLLFMYFKEDIQMNGSFVVVVGVSLIAGRIRPKWTCLAYVMAVVYGVDNWLVWMCVKSKLMDLSYEKMIDLVGVLHMLEGVLTFSFGGKQSIPIMTYRGEKIAGGYQSHQSWLIPLLFFKIKAFYIPVIANIVYANDTFTYEPKEKAKKMGILIGGYGLVMLYIARLVSWKHIPLTLAILGMPVLHEGLFLIDDYLEKGKPKYLYPSFGIRVMEIEEKNGLDISRGDIITSINGRQIINEEYLMEVINTSIRCTLEIEKLSGEKKSVSCTTQEIKAAKIIFLPMY